MTESHVPQAHSLNDWRAAFDTMNSVRGTLEVFRPEVFDLPLGEHIAATATRDWRANRDVQMGLARAAASGTRPSGCSAPGARRPACTTSWCRPVSSASTGSSWSGAAADPRSHRDSTRASPCSTV